MARPIKAECGKTIKAGDTISFSYGIPPVGVKAIVEEKAGALWIVVPPPHKPSSAKLSYVKKWFNIYLEVQS